MWETSETRFGEQLRLSSWLLVRHNNVEKKRFLFRADRLGGYAGSPSGVEWGEEGAVASALEVVGDCAGLVSFLEMVSLPPALSARSCYLLL